MSTRRTLTYAQRKAIDIHLGTIIRTFPDGVCEYLNGESDQSVAKKFDCTVNNVQGVREAVYGRLAPPPPKSPLEGRVNLLEDRVRELEKIIDTLRPTWRQPRLDLEAAE